MLSTIWKERFLKVPGAKQVRDHLLKQGHTEAEAEFGGLIVSGTVIFLTFLLFQSFIFGMIKAFFDGLWASCVQNPEQAIVVGIFGTMFFLAVLFSILRKSSQKRQELHHAQRRDRHKLEEKRQYLKRGAMGNFEEILRFDLSEKHPEIEVKMAHVVDTTPRIQFQAKRFNTELGGKVDKNYQLFRDNLLLDTLHVIETVFNLSENIPVVIVDGMMNFISGNAKYYDGAVISVRVQRDVFNKMKREDVPPFKILSVFDLRYNDGMEVKPIPPEENKTARILERIKEKAPKVDIHYETAREKVTDDWEKPAAEPVPLAETYRGKEMTSMPLAQFQDMVTGLMAKLGFEVKGLKKIPGGMIQIMADFSHPIIGGNFLVLARQYPETAQVHAELVRELDELAREGSYKRGIYVVTAPFTEEARNMTKKLAVDLIDGRRLFELLDGNPYDIRWTFRVVDEKGVVTDLNRMALLNFEQEVDLFLKSMGFRMEKIRRVPGGAVVAVVEHPHPVVGGKFAVMAKQMAADALVSPELVSEFTHVMKAEFCHRGLLMAPAGFSREAMALSRFSGVELVDRNLWENMRRQRGLDA
jgi:hypothetical protein